MHKENDQIHLKIIKKNTESSGQLERSVLKMGFF